MSVREAEAMGRWLDADRRHAEAFLLADAAWRSAYKLRATPEIAEMRREARRHGFVAWGLRAGLATAAVVLIVFIAGLPELTSGFRLAPPSQLYRTEVGQRASVTLSDGTLVTLNTNTLIRAHETFRRRNVDLIRGEAYFQVAKNPARPFVVTSEGKTVTALGTKFAVRADPASLTVTLLQGKVRVATRSRWPMDPRLSTDLEPGVRLVAEDGRPWIIVPANMSTAISWTRGKLVFMEARLSDIVAELNRYSSKRIVLTDPVVANERLSGSFTAGDTDGAVQAIVRYGLARVSVQTPVRVELSAPRASDSRKIATR
jgi:transmembrane sensor